MPQPTDMPALMNPAIRMLVSLASRSGKGGRLTIFIYHRVLSAPDPCRPGETDCAGFDWHMRMLAEQFSVLPLREAVERLKSGSLPARSVSVTFDDGYADNVTNALPILQKYAIPATFFVASGFLHGGCMWNDSIIEGLRRTQLPGLDLSALGLGHYQFEGDDCRGAVISELLMALKHREPGQRQELVYRICELAGVGHDYALMMDEAQLRSLVAAGMEIGGHTVSHPILASMPAEAAMVEISRGKADLEAVTGEPVVAFAYPNGKPGRDYSEEHIGMVRKAGFSHAVCTHWGAAGADGDIFQLPRFTPWDRTPTGFALRLLGNYFDLWE